jgi:uncharacterized protein
MVSSLPPPPSSPEFPPAITLAGEQACVLWTTDGLALEGLARLPSTASRAVVLCHPHPLYGGSMHNAIIVVIARALREAGGDEAGTLRFNYRGVQGSEGRYDDGDGEERDVLSAIDAVQRDLPEARVSVIGYSFGSWVGLRAAIAHEAVDRVGLVAPAARIFKYPELASPRALPIEIVVGDHDQFVQVGDARALAERLGARITVIEGADHYFVKQRRVVADAIVPFLLGAR